jgi:tripartite-type tricarboxylate transporter receptor subunit TctC
MRLPRRTFLHLAAGVAALPAISRIASAQAYPSRPIRLILGFAAGGSADIVARLIAQFVSDRIGAGDCREPDRRLQQSRRRSRRPLGA